MRTLLYMAATFVDGHRGSVKLDTDEGLFRFAVGNGIAPVDVTAVMSSEATARRAAKRSGAGHTVNYGAAGYSAALTAKLPTVENGRSTYPDAETAIRSSLMGWAGFSAHDTEAVIARFRANYGIEA